MANMKDREALIIKHLTRLYGIQAVSEVMAAVNAEAINDIFSASANETHLQSYANDPDGTQPVAMVEPSIPAIGGPLNPELLNSDDFQLLRSLERENVAGAPRHLIETDMKAWGQAWRLSDDGLLAIEQHEHGGILHITRKGIKRLASKTNMDRQK